MPCPTEPIYSSSKGAIDGYDPVAYFKEGKPVKGDEKLMFEWEGAIWYFSTPENLKEFQRHPKKYIPQYGGYCAYAVAHGYTAKVDPTAWKIINNKLYLNYNKNIQQKWEENEGAFIKKANSNWPVVLEQ